MYKLFVLVGIVIFCGSCEKETIQPNRSATELLIKTEWILKSYGYDENKNGIVDLSEESIKDCEKDNSYSFKENGSGNVYENVLMCGNGISDHSFNWQFMNGETEFDFVFGRVKIFLLNENELILYQETNNGNDTVRFIIRFGH